MSSRRESSTTRHMTRARKRMNSQMRICRARKISRRSINGRSADRERSSSVSNKLEALKSLIPNQNREIKSDKLFEEAADYIVLLETQVLILQRLIGFYESNQVHHNAV
ncbi:unnamed protein product [Camellia sinensis]